MLETLVRLTAWAFAPRQQSEPPTEELEQSGPAVDPEPSGWIPWDPDGPTVNYNPRDELIRQEEQAKARAREKWITRYPETTPRSKRVRAHWL